MTSAKNLVEGRPRRVGVAFLLLVLTLSPLEQAQAAESSPTVKQDARQDVAQADQVGAEKQCEVRKLQVLLDIHVVMVKPEDLSKLGDWHQATLCVGRDSATSQDVAGVKNKGTTIRVLSALDRTATNSLRAMMKDMEKDNQLRMVANPQYIVLNGGTALLRVINDEWFLLGEHLEGDFIEINRRELAKIKATPAVSITAHAGDSNDVVLRTASRVFEGQEKEQCTAQEAVTQHTEQYSATVQDGGTVAWAGLTQHIQKEKRPSGLAGLPLIGRFFRSAKATKPSEETVVFMTVLLIPERGQAQEPAPR